MLTEFGPLLMKDVSFVNKITIRVLMVWEGTTTLKERNTILKEYSKTHRRLCKYASLIMSCEAMDNKLLLDKYIN